MHRLYHLVILSLLAAGAAAAQTTSGTIVGSVRDSSDLAVVNADVRITHATTGAVRRGTTNGQGDFTFTAVVPGEYNIVVSSPGFKNSERKSIVLTATETLPRPQPRGEGRARLAVPPSPQARIKRRLVP